MSSNGSAPGSPPSAPSSARITSALSMRWMLTPPPTSMATMSGVDVRLGPLLSVPMVMRRRRSRDVCGSPARSAALPSEPREDPRSGEPPTAISDRSGGGSALAERCMSARGPLSGKCGAKPPASWFSRKKRVL
jgi:hypothetical protein